jgi:hypothetical protein
MIERTVCGNVHPSSGLGAARAAPLATVPGLFDQAPRVIAVQAPLFSNVVIAVIHVADGRANPWSARILVGMVPLTDEDPKYQLRRAPGTAAGSGETQ